MPHDDTIPYANETIEPTNLDGWTAQADDGSVSVSGPCPKCGGDAFGPSLPQVPAIEQMTVVPVSEPERLGPRDIIATCQCGFSHGNPNGENCGRSWFLNVKEHV